MEAWQMLRHLTNEKRFGYIDSLDWMLQATCFGYHVRHGYTMFYDNGEYYMTEDSNE